MLFTFLASLFDNLNSKWEGSISPKVISTVLLTVFSLTLFIALLFQWFPGLVSSDLLNQLGFYVAIDASFTALLIFEVLGLIFVLPKSVSDSVGKQFEILSIILLRSAFKEFDHISHPMLLQSEFHQIYPMLSDAFGALIIFFIIGFFYKAQKHQPITKSDIERTKFIIFKKNMALLLLLAFLVIGVSDSVNFINNGHYEASFFTFYTLLVFSDIFILFYSLRYHSHYINLFRYSSYVFATILIRISLSAASYINVVIGILAGLFVLGLSYAFNYFREEYAE